MNTRTKTMRLHWLRLIISLCLLCTGAWSAAQDLGREAYSQPVAGLDAAAQEVFQRGRIEFMQSWAVPPQGGNVAGLGPLFNRVSCASCHQKNGRGRSPDGPNERMLSMLVRLSIPGVGEHGAPRPHPAYGTQLNEEGVPGVPGEGRAAVHWLNKTQRLSDGTRVSLRQPQLEFVELAYGPLTGVLASPRVGQPAFGLGLLESVPVSQLQELAQQQRRLGLHGSFNRVWDETLQQEVPGRFGFKANSPNLRQQIAEAFSGDMGVTSTLFPHAQCAAKQTACQAVLAATNQPELSAKRLDDIDFFVSHLAPPARRERNVEAVQRGEKLFAASGCSSCHVPQLSTGAHPRFAASLPPQSIEPYTDLLLHDMGPGLADKRPDFRASGRQWRTAPLWGVGLVPVVNGHSQYLHDGRARNLEEAVLWHGGEAQAAQKRYTHLNAAQRQDLLHFLQSL